ncbi:acylphosphatase [Helicobacter sp. T3_23-1056]
MNERNVQNPFVIAHIIAQGKVQGVGYRKFAKASADTFGIVGSTENLASGEVEIYAMCKREEKSEKIMLDFINTLWSGPARGEVQNLIINHIDIVAWEEKEKKILDFLACQNAIDLAQNISDTKSSNNVESSKNGESSNSAKSRKMTKPNTLQETLQDFVILR